MTNCGKCGHPKWGAPECPMDGDCPKVAEFMGRQRMTAAPVGLPVQPDAEVAEEMDRSYIERLEPVVDSSARLFLCPPQTKVMTAEAIRRLDELDSFLLDAMQGGDRDEARVMLNRIRLCFSTA